MVVLTLVGVSLSIKVRTTSKGIFLTVMKETENLLYFLITLPRGVGVFWGGGGIQREVGGDLH